MKILEDPYLRKKLKEGRRFGIGFTILEDLKKSYKPLLPFTACRDYLNDFTYIENTKKELSEIHGYKHEYVGYLSNRKRIYIGVRALDHKNGNSWNEKTKATELLKSNHKNLLKIINSVEKEFRLRGRTRIEVVGDTLVFNAPVFWMKSSPLISLYTLLIRCLFNYTGEYDLSKIKNHVTIIDSDRLYVNTISTAIEFSNRIIEVKKKEYKYPGTTSNYIHPHGISSLINILKREKFK
jgi:hypothetical protein